jgi:hypothetical protein
VGAMTKSQLFSRISLLIDWRLKHTALVIIDYYKMILICILDF